MVTRSAALAVVGALLLVASCVGATTATTSEPSMTVGVGDVQQVDPGNETTNPGENATNTTETTPAQTATTTSSGESENESNPWGNGDNGDEQATNDENATGPDEIRAALGDIYITGYEERDDHQVAVHIYAEEPRPISIDVPYADISSEGVGEPEPASLEETRLSRGTNTVIVDVPEGTVNHRTLWVYGNDMRVPITVELSTGTPLTLVGPGFAWFGGALVGLSAFILGALRVIRKRRGSVRKAEP